MLNIRLLMMVMAVLFAAQMEVMPAYAGNTAYVGGAVGGNFNFSKTCPTGMRITGIAARTGMVIERIRIRCTKISSAGKWSGSHSWITYTNTAAPGNFRMNQYRIAVCSQDKFVGAINGKTTNYRGMNALKQFSVACYKSNASGKRVGGGETQTVTASAGGTSSGWKTCPNADLAYTMNGKRGWYVDQIRFGCKALPIHPTGRVRVIAPMVRFQIPLNPPTLTFPRWNGGAGGMNGYGATPGWQLSLQKVSGVAKYDVCMRRAGTASCFYREKKNATPGGGEMNIPVTIPSSEEGHIVEWMARSCSDNTHCGNWSTHEKFTVVPSFANMTSPANNAMSPSRNIAFSWHEKSSATAGYQLVINKVPLSGGSYNVYNPTASISPNLNIQIPAGTTSKTVAIPASMGNKIQWYVYGCANFPGKGRRCSLGGQTRYVRVAAGTSAHVSFSTLAPTFKHSRCMTCHNFMNTAISTANGTLGKHGSTGHFGSSVDPRHPGASCDLCHSAQVGNGNWRVPSASQSFTNKTNDQLCALTKTLGSAAAVKQHLKQDPRIVWAISSASGNVADSLGKAPPGDINQWNTMVDQWVDGGMHCN